MCGKGMQQTSQQSAMPNLAAMAAYNQAMGQVGRATSTPFQRYSSDPEAYVASLTPTQRAAITNVAGMRGMTDPYYQAAGGLMGAAAELTGAGAGGVGRLTGRQIGEYMSPYMSQVVEPVTAGLRQQFGQQLAQQQAQAIRSGAFGGDRPGLERAVLRGQQGLALGQALSPLYQTGYGQALQTAQGQQAVEAANLQRLLGAGSQLGQIGTAAGQLGSAAQQAALQQANAQLQAGLLEQQTGTAQKQALYGEAQKERMYPLQAAQIQAQAAGALGPLMGSQQQTYQQLPFFGGLFADGGGVDRYSGGLGRARMGGMVSGEGDYARGGYEEGGMADIAAQQRAALGLGAPREEISMPIVDLRPGPAPRIGEAPGRPASGVDISKAGALAKQGFEAKKAYDLAKSKQAMGLEASPFTEAAKGFFGFANGGDVYEEGMSQLLNNPIQAARPMQMEAPESKKSGLKSLLKTGASMAANYFLPGSGLLVNAGLSAAGMADGGRAGYQEGGLSPEEAEYYLRPLARIETGGRKDPYSTLGPETKYGRALGKYQVLESNVPEWTKAALGRALTREEFLRDPEAQEATARHRFGQYLSQAGTPEEAAAMWFGGPGYKKNMGAKDVLGTSIPQYMAKYREGIGHVDLGSIPKGDPRREVMAVYPDRPTTEGAGPSAGLGSAQVKDKSFMERTQEHPESLILPVLQGIGAMAGSKNRYALGAIAEGLGAGAGSYMDMAAKQSEIDKRRQETATEAEETRARSNLARKILSETGEIDVRTAQGAIRRDPEGNPIDAIVDGKWVPFTQIMQDPNAYNLIPEVAREVQAQQQRAGGAPSVNPPPQPLQLPAPPKIPVGVGWGGQASEDAAKSEYASYINSVNKGQLKDTSNKYITRVKDAAAAAEEDRFFTNQIAKIIGQASQQQLGSAPGAGAEWRSNIVGALNTVVRSIPGLEGAGDIFGDIKNQSEVLQKIHQLRSMQQVGSAQERSLGALERQINAMPNLFQDPKASSANIASQIVQSRRALDQFDHLNAYTSLSRGLANNAEADFIKHNKVEKLAPVKKAIETMLTDPGGYIDPNDKSKGYIPPGWKVYESLEGGQIDSKTVEEYFKRLAMKNKNTENAFVYSPGISRFFGEPIYGK